MKIIPLSEGAFSIDQTKVFVPFNKEQDNLQERPKGSLLVEVQPFVVVTHDDIILLDTGLGFSNENAVLQIHQNLADNDINPGDVTKVWLSHLHKDHAGGATLGKGDKQLLSFPNATYFVNRLELDFAIEKGRPSYIPEEFEILQRHPNVQFIIGSGKIAPGIHFETTGAHSPHHMAVWIEEDGQKVFFGADVAPQLQQMKSRFIAKYDYDGKKAMELRGKWWEQANEEHWTMLFYHDIKTPMIGL